MNSCLTFSEKTYHIFICKLIDRFSRSMGNRGRSVLRILVANLFHHVLETSKSLAGIVTFTMQQSTTSLDCPYLITQSLSQLTLSDWCSGGFSDIVFSELSLLSIAPFTSNSPVLNLILSYTWEGFKLILALPCFVLLLLTFSHRSIFVIRIVWVSSLKRSFMYDCRLIFILGWYHYQRKLPI